MFATEGLAPLDAQGVGGQLRAGAVPFLTTQGRCGAAVWYQMPPVLALHDAGQSREWTQTLHYSIGARLPGDIGGRRLAEFIVLSKALFETKPLEIRKTKVLLTIVGGKTVYRDGIEVQRVGSSD